MSWTIVRPILQYGTRAVHNEGKNVQRENQTFSAYFTATRCFFIINTSRLILFRKITDIHFEDYQKQRTMSRKCGVVMSGVDTRYRQYCSAHSDGADGRCKDCRN